MPASLPDLQGDCAMRYDSTSVPERYHSSRTLTSADVSRWVSLVQEVIPHGASTSLIDLGMWHWQIHRATC